MEDPWGHPWAADATPVKVELVPTATAASLEAPDEPLGAAAASPWEHDGDAWGGAGAEAGWNLEPLAGGFAYQVLPDPWANAPSGSEAHVRTGSREPGDVSRIDDGKTRGFSLEASLRHSLTGPPDTNAVDVWTAREPAIVEGPDDGSRTGDGEKRGPSLEASLRHPLTDPADTNVADVRTARETAVVEGLNDGPRTGDDETRGPSLEASLRHPLPDPLGTQAKDKRTVRELGVVEAPTPAPESPEALPRRALGAKHGQPSRVQGLVEMFDGIAKRNISSVAMAGREAVAKEDSRQELELGSEKSEPQPTYPPKTSQDSPARLSVEEARDDRLEEGLKATAGPGDGQDLISRGKKGPQHIDYPIDMSRLDDLYPSVPAQPPEPGRGSATFGSDLFTSVSERRAWYRISRFGSMRRHDQGDPDDYVLVGWAASRVRERTVELVRQWMEQDSLGGRVVLGRRVGLGGGSMFNWDSAAAPVEIAELLRRRGKSNTIAAHAATEEASAAMARGSSPVATSWPVSFGAEPSDDALIQDQESSRRWQLAGPPDVSSTTPVLPVQSFAEAPQASEGADDDEWGDMVSPTVTDTKGTFEASFSGVEAVVNRGLSPLDSARPSLGEVSRSGEAGMDRTEVLTTVGDASLGWAWSVGLDDETTKPTPAPAAQAAQAAKGPSRHNPSQGSRLGADHASLLRSPSGKSTDNPTAASGPTSEKGGAGRDEVVARILSNLPDLSYMLR